MMVTSGLTTGYAILNALSSILVQHIQDTHDIHIHYIRWISYLELMRMLRHPKPYSKRIISKTCFAFNGDGEFVKIWKKLFQLRNNYGPENFISITIKTRNSQKQIVSKYNRKQLHWKWIEWIRMYRKQWYAQNIFHQLEHWTHQMIRREDAKNTRNRAM